MKKYTLYKTAYPNKTDAEIIEMLAWELSEKVKSIYSLLPPTTINRVWAMPSAFTFTIKPIKDLIDRYVYEGACIVDPWANNSKIGTIRNDLNPDMDTHFHLDALDFLKQQDSDSADIILYDPPYSISQATEMYNSYGKDKLEKHVSNMGYWGGCKNEVARILKTGGICIICGWSSNGIGLSRFFEMVEVLLVPHGGSKNDTIVTVERKLSPPTPSQYPLF